MLLRQELFAFPGDVGLAHLAVVYLSQRSGCICRAAQCESAASPLLPGGWGLGHSPAGEACTPGSGGKRSLPLAPSLPAHTSMLCGIATELTTALLQFLRTCKTGRPKWPGMETDSSLCLWSCLGHAEPLQPDRVTCAPPGAPTITQLCKIHYTSASSYSYTACATTSSESCCKRGKAALAPPCSPPALHASIPCEHGDTSAGSAPPSPAWRQLVHTRPAQSPDMKSLQLASCGFILLPWVCSCLSQDVKKGG